jgi:predicted RNA-binding Zn ribbon-like protein
LDAVREIALDGLGRAVLEWSDGTFGWAWPDDGDLDRVTWAVAHAATELLTSPRLERLKLCAGCRWVFIDASKNRSRRWCHMDECGTHEKVRRYVARRAAARESTPR